MGKKSRALTTSEIVYQNFRDGVSLVAHHPIFGRLMRHIKINHDNGTYCVNGSWEVADSDGRIWWCRSKLGTPSEWAYVTAHSLLHYAFDHFREDPHPKEWNVACDAFITKFLQDIKFGTPPEEMRGVITLGAQSEQKLYERILRDGVSNDLKDRGVAGPFACDMRWTGSRAQHWDGRLIRWDDDFARGLADAASSAVNVAAGLEPFVGSVTKVLTPAQRARTWFISSYPLLGALAAAFTLIEDAAVCNRMQISIAAVHAVHREIYINPSSQLTEMECRFVMAHEFLHVGLQHEQRRRGRDAYLWNVACDYVINGWLVEMGIGEVPAHGMLHDQELKGMSSEEIYDLIAKDLRRARKLRTLRGNCDEGDMMEGPAPEWWSGKDGMTLDDFYRRALRQGFEYHQQSDRGLLPSNLVEEINALLQPPIPWDVELAQWFDHYFPPLEKRRSYARPSRRQSATPDIARASWVPAEYDDARTFGVVLDTSGSMSRDLLARALGAIASYCNARDVPFARVIFCDAIAYDQGYMSPESIAGRVKVRGRGGTVLQPGVDILEKAKDFPQKGPILIITDTFCENNLRVHRDHAFLVPENHYLPFTPRGKVFYID